MELGNESEKENERRMINAESKEEGKKLRWTDVWMNEWIGYMKKNCKRKER